MFPELLTIGKFTLYTYGLCVAIGFLLAIIYISKYTDKVSLTKNQIYDFIFYLIIVSVIGARLFYALTNIDYYMQYPLDIVKVWQGGLVFYGGFIFAIIYSIIYCLCKKIDIKKLADLFAPALALGHCFGRIGCFFSGCCYGKQTDFCLAIENKHPTQLYESFLNLVLFFILNKIYKKSHKDGNVFLVYLVCYSILRFCIEFLRDDDRGTFIFSLSPAQNISIAIFVIAIILMAFNNKKDNNLQK